MLPLGVEELGIGRREAQLAGVGDVDARNQRLD